MRFEAVAAAADSHPPSAPTDFSVVGVGASASSPDGLLTPTSRGSSTNDLTFLASSSNR
jgi:hypothetical protein